MADCGKDKRHLELLRSEYLKLQVRLAESERKNAAFVASVGSAEDNDQHFILKLQSTVASLHNSPKLSDIKIILDDDIEIHAHRLVLASRNQKIWNPAKLEDVQVLDWRNLMPSEVAKVLIRWIYTDSVDFNDDADIISYSSSPDVIGGASKDAFMLCLMNQASKFELSDLLLKCQQHLMGSIDARNCIKFYSLADEIEAKTLKSYCFDLISANWDLFGCEDFESMTSSLLYTMLKSKTEYPLHAAIRLRREEVTFLFLIEFNHDLVQKVNSIDDKGDIALDLALSSKQEAIASNLLRHEANVNQVNGSGKCLLHLAIERKDEFAALFLLNNGALVNTPSSVDGNTALHLVSSMEKVAQLLIDKGANVNAINDQHMSPFHISIINDDRFMLELFMTGGNVDFSLKTNKGYTPLWLAIEQDNLEIATELLLAGASPDATVGFEEYTPLYKCATLKKESAALFLVSKGASIITPTSKGQLAIHVASANGLTSLVETLLACPVVDVNMQTNLEVGRQTPLHLAINNGHADVIKALMSSSNLDPNLRNSSEESPLGLALGQHMFAVAKDLVLKGADVNARNSSADSLLSTAIEKGDTQTAIFLLDHGADCLLRNAKNETVLELAVRNQLTSIVEAICRHCDDLSASSKLEDPPLWLALQNESIAEILVRFDVDLDAWSPGPGKNVQQTLLHRALDENLQEEASILIRARCDIDSPRRILRVGEPSGEEACDLATPLHLCALWGLTDVANILVKYGAVISAQDVEGKTPLHYAIENGHYRIIDLLLECPQINIEMPDKYGLSAFALALKLGNNTAAKKILAVEPYAAEQMDRRGRNFLHQAILRCDLPAVLFLLSVHVNIHSRTTDSECMTPIRLAINVGDQMILRNLILAGAFVNESNSSHKTLLHDAANKNFHEICSILLSNGLDFSAVDNNGQNALHEAVKEGHLEVVRVLLTESHIDAEAINNKGQNCLHVLCKYSQDQAVAIFRLFLECMPNYRINATDHESGNTALMLAYMNGNGPLCRELIKHGAILGTLNQNGISIFNCQVATNKLLRRILDSLVVEPPWGDGDFCQNCVSKFGMTTRRHHCRHCGRLLCSKCSAKEMAIIKYDLTKPVRVCNICADVLVLGA